MTTRILLAASAAMSMALTGCVETDDVSETSDKLLAKKCLNFACSVNRARLTSDMWFHEMNLGGENEEGVSLNLWHTMRNQRFRTLRVVGDQIHLDEDGTLPDEVIQGSALTNSRMEVTIEENTGEKFYQLIFTGVHQVVPLDPIPGHPPRTGTFYEILVKQIGTPDAAVSLCDPTKAFLPTGGVDPSYAVLFNGNRFNFHSRTVPRSAFDGPWFNVACAGTAMAAMYQDRVLEVSEPDGTQVPHARVNEIFRTYLKAQQSHGDE